jgi:hypothetical protein
LNGPEGRTEASLVWDAADHVLLLFGGANGAGGIDGDVWAYSPAGDGTAVGRWTRLNVGGSVPYGRHLHSAVWDGKDRQMLVFGGQTATMVLNDLWAFRPNVAAGRGTWRQVMAQTPLTPRFSQSAAWDATHWQMLVFGGANGSGRYLDDLWAYHPDASGVGSWTNLGSPGVPDGRATSGAAWDTDHGALFLVGGTGMGSYRNDTYAYRPDSGWTTLTPAAPLARRSNPAVVYDTTTGGILLYGGTGFTGAYSDLWQLGGVPVQPTPQPTTTTSSGKTGHKPPKKH